MLLTLSEERAAKQICLTAGQVLTDEQIRDLGLVPWYGGPCAPADWDGNRNDLLFRDAGCVSRLRTWEHTQDGCDVIGYCKRGIKG